MREASILKLVKQKVANTLSPNGMILGHHRQLAIPVLENIYP